MHHSSQIAENPLMIQLTLQHAKHFTPLHVIDPGHRGAV